MNPAQIITQMIPQLLSGGGPQVVILMLMGVIAFFWFERKRLLDEVKRKDEKIDKIIEDYQNGNTTLTDAFTQLRIVLAEIRAKLTR